MRKFATIVIPNSISNTKAINLIVDYLSFHLNKQKEDDDILSKN